MEALKGTLWTFFGEFTTGKIRQYKNDRKCCRNCGNCGKAEGMQNYYAKNDIKGSSAENLWKSLEGRRYSYMKDYVYKHLTYSLETSGPWILEGSAFETWCQRKSKVQTFGRFSAANHHKIVENLDSSFRQILHHKMPITNQDWLQATRQTKNIIVKYLTLFPESLQQTREEWAGREHTWYIYSRGADETLSTLEPLQ